MRRVAALATAIALAAAACGGDEDAGDPVSGNPDAVGVPGVEPSVPPPGETARLRAVTEASGSDPTTSFPRPRLLLGRTPSEAQRSANRAAAPGAATGLQAWDDFHRRVLIAVLGPPQPDSGHSIRIDDVVVANEGRVLTVTGAVESAEGGAQQVVSIPWALLSAKAGTLSLVERCVLALEGQRRFAAPCR